MIHSITLPRDEQVFDLLEVLNDAYSLPESLEDLKEKLEFQRERIIEATIDKLEGL